MYVFGVFFLSFGLLAASPDPDAMRKVYHQGVQQFKQQKIAEAKKSFTTLLPWLIATQKQRKKGTKAWHLMTLGQCDVYHFLGRIAEASKQPRLACRHYRTMAKQFKTVPPTWKGWNVNPSLPSHLAKASSRWRQFCPTVTSILTLSVTPSGATIEQQKDGKWSALSGNQLETTKTTVALRITAPGYEPKELRTVPVPRWSSTSQRIALTKKKKKVIVVRRDPVVAPKPVVPVYKKAWFWAVVGTGVAIAATAVIIPTVAYVNRGTVIGCNGGAFRVSGCP